MRLFIAIPLSESARDDVERAQRAMVQCGVRGNYVARANLHLTLAFIGEYPDPEDVLEVLRGVPLAPFELRLSSVGAFADTWWVGMEDSAPLLAYVKRLRRALAEAGIPFDRKRFRAHVTLARRVDAGGRPMPALPPPGAVMTVERAALMRSTLRPEGPIYTELD